MSVRNKIARSRERQRAAAGTHQPSWPTAAAAAGTAFSIAPAGGPVFGIVSASSGIGRIGGHADDSSHNGDASASASADAAIFGAPLRSARVIRLAQAQSAAATCHLHHTSASLAPQRGSGGTTSSASSIASSSGIGATLGQSSVAAHDGAVVDITAHATLVGASDARAAAAVLGDMNATPFSLPVGAC